MNLQDLRTGTALAVSAANTVSNTGTIATGSGIDGISCVFTVTSFAGGGTKTASVQASNDGTNYASLSATHYNNASFTITANGTFEISLSQNQTIHRHYRVVYSGTGGGTFSVVDTLVTYVHQN
jgi:hypothetical protein